MGKLMALENYDRDDFCLTNGLGYNGLKMSSLSMDSNVCTGEKCVGLQWKLSG